MYRKNTGNPPASPYNGYLDPVENILRRFGLNSSYKGFHFVKYAVVAVKESPDILTFICKGLYIQIAEHFKTTGACVERDIRTVKNVIWRSQRQALRIEIFGEDFENKPPNNAAFLDMLVFYIYVKKAQNQHSNPDMSLRDENSPATTAATSGQMPLHRLTEQKEIS